MTTRIDADLLIPGRGEPIRDGTIITEGDAIACADLATLGPQAPLSGQLKERYDADVITIDPNPREDSSGWGRPDRVTHVWQAGAIVKQPS